MISGKIHMESNEIADYFRTHAHNPYMYEIIAEVCDVGLEISLSNEDGKPCIIVNDDDTVLDETVINDLNNCEMIVDDIYEHYLSQDYLMGCHLSVADDEEDYNDDECLAAQELIENREMEIEDAVDWMLGQLVPNLNEIRNDVDGVITDIKELICMRLYRTHGISIYRPMYLENDDGTINFTKYPYSEMEIIC